MGKNTMHAPLRDDEKRVETNQRGETEKKNEKGNEKETKLWGLFHALINFQVSLFLEYFFFLADLLILSYLCY